MRKLMLVSIDVDPVPGDMDNENIVANVAQGLVARFDHYNPKVTDAEWIVKNLEHGAEALEKHSI